MWRALLFIGLVAVAAFFAVWLADQPGAVVVTWGPKDYEISLAVAAVLTIGIGITIALVILAARFLVRLERGFLAQRFGVALGLFQGAVGVAPGISNRVVGCALLGSGSPDECAARDHTHEQRGDSS